MLRVLVGGFGRVARLGIRDVLATPDLVVVGECWIDGTMTTVEAVRPDVLVLDIDVTDKAMIAMIASAHPEIAVVACSADSTSMLVYPRFGGRTYSRELTSDALLECVRG